MTVLEVTGEDAGSFLQGQLTCDVEELDPARPSLGAWCNPKGRVIALFRIRAMDDGYAMSMPDDLAEAVTKRLTMFRFRAKADFSTRPATAADLGEHEELSFADWTSRNLEDGVASIATEQSEKFTPHMLNLDLLNAISFDKGCYTGQEVVARTHYRGATRRRLLKFSCAGPVQPGDKVTLEGRDVGDVVNTVGDQLLAVVPVESADAGLEVNGAALTYVPLPYVQSGQ